MESSRWTRLLAGLVAPWRGAHTGADFLAGPVPHGGPTLEQSIPEGLHPMEKTHVGEVCEGLSPVGGTPRWSRGRV